LPFQFPLQKHFQSQRLARKENLFAKWKALEEAAKMLDLKSRLSWPNHPAARQQQKASSDF